MLLFGERSEVTESYHNYAKYLGLVNTFFSAQWIFCFVTPTLTFNEWKFFRFEVKLPTWMIDSAVQRCCETFVDKYSKLWEIKNFCTFRFFVHLTRWTAKKTERMKMCVFKNVAFANKTLIISLSIIVSLRHPIFNKECSGDKEQIIFGHIISCKVASYSACYLTNGDYIR